MGNAIAHYVKCDVFCVAWTIAAYLIIADIIQLNQFDSFFLLYLPMNVLAHWVRFVLRSLYAVDMCYCGLLVFIRRGGNLLLDLKNFYDKSFFILWKPVLLADTTTFFDIFFNFIFAVEIARA